MALPLEAARELAKLVERYGRIHLDWSPPNTFRLQASVIVESDLPGLVSYARLVAGDIGSLHLLEPYPWASWRVDGRQAIQVIRAIRPYMERHQSQADLALDVFDWQQEYGEYPEHEFGCRYLEHRYVMCSYWNLLLPPLHREVG